MKFNNRPNECVTTTDGRQIWASRSVTVTACILLECHQHPFILVNQRGIGVPDFAGYWNLPCGYLDYDETTTEAAVREVWEECGVDTLALLETATCDFFTQPWDVGSNPTGNRQNVTIHHGLYAKVDTLPALSNAYNEPDETADLRWLPLSEVHTLEFAFHHRERIAKFVAHVEKVAGVRWV